MSHFAQIDENNKVIQVLVVEQEFVNTGLLGDPSKWIQTSYNTRGNWHPDGRPLRYNYAGVGYTYDPVKDAFIAPQPYPSWILNEDTCIWEPPIPAPVLDEGFAFQWNEDILNWNVYEIAPIAPVFYDEQGNRVVLDEQGNVVPRIDNLPS
jgi:hypothetical protein